MKFPYSMLLDFVETKLSATQIGDLLTMAGFELEGIEEVEGEPVLDIKVVSNRGDGLSVFGLSREVLAKDPNAKPTDLYNQAAARFRMPDQEAGNAATKTSVAIETPDCTRYACRLFEAVKNGSAPTWIQDRLRRCGMRPISLLVDLTNYVMLELGQPLHVFDKDKLHGGRIVVRQAKAGEELTTLDGNEHKLRPDQMMICDADRPVAAAGVMGGLETEVTESTTNVLLESAHFVNTSVRRTRKQLGLNTEASYRFERSVDPEGVVSALNRFAQLLATVPGAAVAVPGVVDVYPAKPQIKPLALRLSRVHRLLNMEITAEQAKGYLQRLGFKVEGDSESFTVTPPTWRPDIEREEDLIEELGRVHGYEKIPELPPVGKTTQGGVGEFEHFVDRLREEAVRCGFTQIISHSLRDLHPLDDPNDGRLGPRVPASPETAYLRNSLLPSLADADRRNGAKDLHLFEIGCVFSLGKQGMEERKQMAFLSSGSLAPTQWIKTDYPQADFFSLKGALEDILGAAQVTANLRAPNSDELDPRLHPTRQAVIVVSGEVAGIIGTIHPDAAEASDLGEGAVLAEIQPRVLFKHHHGAPHLRPVSKNPSVRRDIALLIDKAVPYEQIKTAVEQACGQVLEKQWLFDVYEGKGIPEGKHSLAIALQLRKVGENFTDEEANLVREKAVTALAGLGAIQR